MLKKVSSSCVGMAEKNVFLLHTPDSDKAVSLLLRRTQLGSFFMLQRSLQGRLTTFGDRVHAKTGR